MELQSFRPTGARHRFVLQRPATTLRLKLEEFEAARFRLTVGDIVHQGSGAEIETEIPASTTTAHLDGWLEEHERDEDPTVTWIFALGHVDPHEEIAGVLARLDNLGYRSAQVADAVTAYKRERGLPVSGKIDDAVKQALRSDHDVNRRGRRLGVVPH